MTGSFGFRVSMNRGLYNRKLTAAKRRIFDSLKSDGLEIQGVRHRKLISSFFNRNGLKCPIQVRWQDYIISLYEANKLPEIVPKKRIPKDKVKQAATERRQIYEDYLNSKEWRTFRLQALEHFGNRCGLCDSDGQLDLHHKTYKNFMNETFADVIPLCRKCHKRHHGR